MIKNVEEWMKPTCQKYSCKYYSHHDYPHCSYCLNPDDLCPVLYLKERKKVKRNEVHSNR